MKLFFFVDILEYIYAKDYQNDNINHKKIFFVKAISVNYNLQRNFIKLERRFIHIDFFREQCRLDLISIKKNMYLGQKLSEVCSIT